MTTSQTPRITMMSSRSMRISPPLSAPTPRWVPDHERSSCACCRRRFSMFQRRRHHCRNCGECVCDDCSPHRVRLPGATRDRVRVCDICFRLATATTSVTTLPPPTTTTDSSADDGGEGGAGGDSPVRQSPRRPKVAVTVAAQHTANDNKVAIPFYIQIVVCSVSAIVMETPVNSVLSWLVSSCGIRHELMVSFLVSYALCMLAFQLYHAATTSSSSSNDNRTTIEYPSSHAPPPPQQPTSSSSSQSPQRNATAGNGVYTETEQYWIDSGTKAIEQCYSYIRECQTNTGGWCLDKSFGSSADHSLIEVFKRKSLTDGSRKAFMTRGMVNVSPQKLHEMFMDYKTTPSWNPQVREYHMLQVVNDNVCVMDCIAAPAAGGAISSRDFVDIRVQKRLDDGSWLLGGHSVEIDICPPHKGVIRGVNGPGGWFSIATDDPEWTWFYWVMDTDLKGWLPRSLIEATLASTHVDFVKLLRRVVREKRL